VVRLLARLIRRASVKEKFSEEKHTFSSTS
jgi:hypothetical protein